MKVFGLIPAAGQSRRMGQEKLRLLIQGQPLLLHLMQAFRAGGVQRLLVVLGPTTADLAPLVRENGADVLRLIQPTADMQGTVQQGLAWFTAHDQPREEDILLCCPADFPAVTADVVATLRQAMQDEPQTLVAIPTHEGQKGHPIACRGPVLAVLQAAPPGMGMNIVLRQFTETTKLLPLEAPGILVDVDFPTDYEQITSRLGKMR